MAYVHLGRGRLATLLLYGLNYGDTRLLAGLGDLLLKTGISVRPQKRRKVARKRAFLQRKKQNRAATKVFGQQRQTGFLFHFKQTGQKTQSAVTMTNVLNKHSRRAHWLRLATKDYNSRVARWQF